MIFVFSLLSYILKEIFSIIFTLFTRFKSIKSIKLVDISGRQLQNIQNINTKNYVINLNVNPQVVVVVVENTNGTIESRKVILK